MDLSKHLVSRKMVRSTLHMALN